MLVELKRKTGRAMFAKLDNMLKIRLLILAEVMREKTLNKKNLKCFFFLSLGPDKAEAKFGSIPVLKVFNLRSIVFVCFLI